MANEISINLNVAETYAGTTVQLAKALSLNSAAGAMQSTTVAGPTSAAVLAIGDIGIHGGTNPCLGMALKFNGTGASDTASTLKVGLDATVVAYTLCTLVANGPPLFLPDLTAGSTNTGGIPYVIASTTGTTYSLTLVS